MPCNLHSLLRTVGIKSSYDFPDVLIESIGCDSRSIKKDELFFGLSGVNVDGGKFWRDALDAGAAAAVIGTNAAGLYPPCKSDMVIVLPEPVSYWMGELSAVFWDEPSLKLPLIGVTGTNGKTTTSHLIEYLATQSGIASALFGTLVNRWPQYSEVAIHTTSFGDELQEQLAKAVLSGASLAAMEVSSHSLAQNRVAGCRFSGAVFTNLTQDHLDYHQSMDEYFKAKSLLFQSPYLQEGESRAVINIDDYWGRRLADRLGKKCWRASIDKGLIKSMQPELFLTELKISSKGSKGLLHSPCGEGRFSSPLVGRFNLMNLLEAVGVLLQQGIALDDILCSIKSFPGVPGRMESILLEGELPGVIVDYAHTPDGLKNALSTLRPFVSGRLFCVFGCGGDRDSGKRAQMGAIASQLADCVIITSDNPRTEDPRQILLDIVEGIPPHVDIHIEEDREIAIKETILKALPDDMVLIAGKGHENYQILGREVIEFDDRDIARESLKLLMKI